MIGKQCDTRLRLLQPAQPLTAACLLNCLPAVVSTSRISPTALLAHRSALAALVSQLSPRTMSEAEARDLAAEQQQDGGAEAADTGADADADAEIEAMRARVAEMEEEARRMSELSGAGGAGGSAAAGGAAAAGGVGSPSLSGQAGPAGVGRSFLTPEQSSEQDSRSIHVSQVDYSVTEEELRQLFEACGSVNRATILKDKFSGAPRGYAYIEFASADSIANAMILNETEFKGRTLKVRRHDHDRRHPCAHAHSARNSLIFPRSSALSFSVCFFRSLRSAPTCPASAEAVEEAVVGGAATVAALAVAAAMALTRLAAPAGTVRSEAAADEGVAAEAEEDSIPISSSSNIRRAPFFALPLASIVSSRLSIYVRAPLWHATPRTNDCRAASSICSRSARSFFLFYSFSRR